jgi:hypothetical protein
MSLVCGQCSRVNPAEAAYCYFDGAALAGRAGGPINAGSAPFPNQFVFPNGMACRNFDQLAVACQQHWPAAIDLLKQGYLGSFFGGMGRVDLAMAAQEAAKFPDLDRGLDQLIAKLPSQAVQAPKLQAEPSEINLGQVKVGDNRVTELHLTNLGMRLLYGTVTSDCKWLTLGDAPGHPEKMVQFGVEAVIPVQVRGQHLRAGTKPNEGHLIIDSNGGTITVTFKADVPIVPYADGLFAGAVTPRKVAEQAKAKPKDAAPYFEKGDVAAWYAANGWAYPVQGPIMSGMGSIQQFFEALGVAKAPKVEFKPTALDLAGGVGKKIEASIEVATAEKKVVYGWATCEKTWVEVGKTKLSGKTATIPITIKIPKPCPPTLETTLMVMGNGNQKLAVPLKVAVAGGKAGVTLAEDFVKLEVIEEPDEPVLLEVVEEQPVVLEVIEERPPPAPAPASAPAPVPLPTAVSATPAPAAPPPAEVSPFALDEPVPPSTPAVQTAIQAGEPPSGARIARAPARLPLPARIALHLIPAAVLFICLLPTLMILDAFGVGGRTKGGGGGDGGEDDYADVDRRPHVKIVFDEGRQGDDYKDTMNFAVHKIDPIDKNAPSVKLNWYENGYGNSIVAQIDGKDAVFGDAGVSGKWFKGKEFDPAKDPPKGGFSDVDYTKGGLTAGKFGGKKRTYDFQKEGIHITQTVTIEPGEAVEVAPGEYKRQLTTCLVRYKIYNATKDTHKVGLRVLMDTCIGNRDDVPFTLPGVEELVTTSKDFHAPNIPDFVQVLEKGDLKDPGTILQLNLRVSDKFEAPDRFLLTRYPGREGKAHNKWEIPVRDMADDSSVVIYWNPKPLEGKKTREVGFTYGLGNVAVDKDKGKLGLTVGGSTYQGGELTVVAFVTDSAAKWATLELPDGLKLLEGKQALRQPVPPSRDGRAIPVTWRVRAASAGKHTIAVTTDTGLAKSRRVTITAKSLFN